MQDRFEQAEKKDSPEEITRPVVTISRDFGCPSKEIVHMLHEALSNTSEDPELPWEIISKEILHNSAKELDLHPSKLDYVFKAEDKTTMDEILEALGEKYHKSDRQIRKTISTVVHSMAIRGKLIIIGMGACSILMHQPNVFHVKLIGPKKWRVDNIERWQGISHLTASKLVNDIDHQRAKIIKSFLPRGTHEPLYDMVINCMNIDDVEIVDILHDLIRRRDQALA